MSSTAENLTQASAGETMARRTDLRDFRDMHLGSLDSGCVVMGRYLICQRNEFHRMGLGSKKTYNFVLLKGQGSRRSSISAINSQAVQNTTIFLKDAPEVAHQNVACFIGSFRSS